jgi:hypothetical protein
MKSIILFIAILLVGVFSASADPKRPPRRMSYTGQWIGDSDSRGPKGAQPLEGYTKENGPTRSYSKETHRHRRYAASRPDQSGVRTNAVVKVYGVGRYVDPADCRIMHERHAVYRLEESSGWRLQPPPYQPEVLMGPIVGLRRAEYAPEPVAGEVGRELIATRRNTQEAVDGVRTVTQDQLKVRQDLDQNLKRINQNEETLLKELGDLKRRADETESKIPNTNNNQPKAPGTPGNNGVELATPNGG